MKPAINPSQGLVLALAAVVISGCAHQRPQPLYYWGAYQSQVYEHFKAETGPEEQIAVLEAEVEHAKATNQALPPGFQAHLAMLYGKTGHADKLVSNLEAEKRQFPEGSTFMDFLLKKFQK
jgi:hypothetical protein